MKRKNVMQKFLNKSLSASRKHVAVRLVWFFCRKSLTKKRSETWPLVKRGWELMKVGMREFAWDFSQLSCPSQTRTRVAWELMRFEWLLPKTLIKIWYSSKSSSSTPINFELVQILIRVFSRLIIFSRFCVFSRFFSFFLVWVFSRFFSYNIQLTLINSHATLVFFNRVLNENLLNNLIRYYIFIY